MTFIGLDLETSGTDINRGAVPIQLGLAHKDSDGLMSWRSSMIGEWEWCKFDHEWHASMTDCDKPSWSIKAEAIHGLLQERVDRSPNPWWASTGGADTIEKWCYDVPRIGRHIVGFNVAGFDLPFVRRYMRELADSLSYRTVDLNAVLFAIDQAWIPSPSGGRWKYKTLKKVVKEAAAEKAATHFDGEVRWHDAAFDAVAALYVWDDLVRIIRR